MDFTYYKGNLLEEDHYYPYGLQINALHTTALPNNNPTRYGFNGQEKEDEIAGRSNITSAQFWQYDATLGRRWNVDPKPNASISPLATFANNPMLYTDKLGDTTYNFLYNKKQKVHDYIGMADLNKKGAVGVLLNLTGTLPSTTNFTFADPVNHPKDLRNKVVTRLKYMDIKSINAIYKSRIGDEIDKAKNTFYYNTYMGLSYLKLHSNAQKTGILDATTDFQTVAEANTLYLTIGKDTKGKEVKVAHDKYNFGNFLWGGAAAALHVGLNQARAAAHYNNYYWSESDRGTLDSDDDQYSIKLGYRSYRNSHLHERKQKGLDRYKRHIE